MSQQAQPPILATLVEPVAAAPRLPRSAGC